MTSSDAGRGARGGRSAIVGSGRSNEINALGAVSFFNNAMIDSQCVEKCDPDCRLDCVQFELGVCDLAQL